ncbi:MAG TPA: BACON domain-containing carbohydrate-binding protein [Vicinamibacterales bacterium]|nr:BACON domain-containing carbohydrate-binding protein [Vicinamibacterales bacterium]
MRMHGFAAALLAIAPLTMTCGGNGVITEPRVCTISVSPPSGSFDHQAAAGQVTVSAQATCTWSAAASASWITITAGAAGTGAGVVTYLVSANGATDARTAAITIGAQSHQVVQQGRPLPPCAYALSPAGAEFEEGAATGSFAVATAAGCGWTATSSAPWLTVASGREGSGPGTVSYALAINDDPVLREATIGVADQRFAVRQSAAEIACEYSVTPVEFNPCMPGGTQTATLATQAGCSWTAASNVPWLAISPAAGAGPGQITLSYTENYDAPRQGAAMVRWPSPTEGQNVWIRQAGCTYGVSRTAVTVAATGASASVDVYQQSDPIACGGATQDRCVWSAVSDVAWITITSPMPRSGDNPFSFTVAPNTSGVSRTGRITVRDRVIVVSQAGT